MWEKCIEMWHGQFICILGCWQSSACFSWTPAVHHQKMIPERWLEGNRVFSKLNLTCQRTGMQHACVGIPGYQWEFMNQEFQECNMKPCNVAAEVWWGITFCFETVAIPKPLPCLMLTETWYARIIVAFLNCCITHTASDMIRIFLVIWKLPYLVRWILHH